MKETKFYICRRCGSVAEKVTDSGIPLVCCGEKMEELIPNTTDAAHEKHIPVVRTEKTIVNVSVGSVPHPMTEAHYIQWIFLETENGTQRKELNPGDAPTATFALADGDKVISVYAYCNLHGLWKA